MTYLLGSYQLGRFLSSTKVYHEADAPSRDDFIFAQLVHDGDWDPIPRPSTTCSSTCATTRP